MQTETEFTNLPAFKPKIDKLFELEKITLNDIEDLDNDERKYLAEAATEILAHLTGNQRENFLSKIEPIVPVSTKAQIWEHNQYVISRAVNKLLHEQGFMPTKSAISNETGLSRQTIAKHLKEYKAHPAHLAEMDQFKFMTTKILANVFKYATNGDVKAARLYFEMVGAFNKQHTSNNTFVNEQNNYIQINNTILSQENLRHLTAEQLNQIESIITNRTG